MNRGQSPTPEELKFIYKLILDGYSDSDILRKYEELKRYGKLGSLPVREDIRFIRQRRKEFEAARAILEPYLKQRIDPAVVKATNRHHSEIRNLLEQWMETLKERISSAYFAYRSDFNYGEEDFKLFPYLLQHCPSVKDNYEVIKGKREKYKREIESLKQKVAREVSAIIFGDLVDILDFSESVVISALSVTEGLPSCYNYAINANAFLRFINTHGNQDIIKYYQQRHDELVDRYSQTEDVRSLVTYAQELRELEKVLAQSIEVSLLKQEYLYHKCDYCPFSPN